MDALDEGGPASEHAALIYGVSSLLRSTWRRLPPRDRDALLAELSANAAGLQAVLSGRPRTTGPSPEDVRRELRAPTSRVYLQPIVWLPTREVVGYEALTRFTAFTPDQWFARAWQLGVGLDFELGAIRRALPILETLPGDLYLAINLSPLTLLATDLLQLLDTTDPRRLVLELTEHENIADYDLYRRQLKRLRRLGVRIAVDDAGAGHASLRHIVQLAPDIVKLDKALSSECHRDPVRRSLLSCLAMFASQTKTSLVAEGIECAEELRALVSFGIAFGQGYYLGRPKPEAVLDVDGDTGGWVVADAASPNVPR